MGIELIVWPKLSCVIDTIFQWNILSMVVCIVRERCPAGILDMKCHTCLLKVGV